MRMAILTVLGLVIAFGLDRLNEVTGNRWISAIIVLVAVEIGLIIAI